MSVKGIRIAACLLFLAFLSASLDRIADPPAVNPHGSQALALSLSHPPETVWPHNCDRMGWVLGIHTESGWIDITPTAKSRNPNRRPTVVRQAGDPSPPRTS